MFQHRLSSHHRFQLSDQCGQKALHFVSALAPGKNQIAINRSACFIVIDLVAEHHHKVGSGM